MNKITVGIIVSSAAILSASALAGGVDTAAGNNGAGVYISGNMGYGYVDQDKPSIPGSVSGLVNLNSSVSQELGGFGWNAAVGYQFNRYVALEGGYIQMPTIRDKVTVTATNPNFPGTSATDTVNIKVRPNLIYLAVKGIYPINQQFDLFAKLGAARTGGTGSAKSTVSVTNNSQTSSAVNADINGQVEHDIVPLYGLGVGYNINDNLSLSAQGLGTVSTGTVPSMYQATLGLTYKFAV